MDSNYRFRRRGATVLSLRLSPHEPSIRRAATPGRSAAAPALLAQRRQKLKCRARREDADKIRPAHCRPRAQGSPIGAGVSHIRQKAEAVGTCLSAAVEQERSRQREVRNGRGQKLQSDLKRYRTLRDLIHDEPAMATIEEMIREAEDRLRQIESGPDPTSLAT